jgi:hypothetical protein
VLGRHPGASPAGNGANLALHSLGRRDENAEKPDDRRSFRRDFPHCTEKRHSPARFSDMVAAVVGANKRKGVAKLYLVYLLHLFTLSFSRSGPTPIGQIELLHLSRLVARPSWTFSRSPGMAPAAPFRLPLEYSGVLRWTQPNGSSIKN